MKYNLTNKIILVTGASRGIGKTIATKLAENGASIVLLSRKESDLQKMASEFSNRDFKYIYKTTDVSNLNDLQDAVKYTLDTWGGIHGIVNNAGITRDGLLLRMKEVDWDLVLNINLKGSFLCSQQAIKQMLKQKSGSIVNIASIVEANIEFPEDIQKFTFREDCIIRINRACENLNKLLLLGF